MRSLRFQLIISALGLLFFSAGFLPYQPARAEEPNIFTQFIENTVNPGLPEGPTGEGDPIQVVVLNTVKVLLGFLGLLLILYLLYGGFTWMTSQGNSEKLEQAKAIIRNAIIGLVIVMASYGIAVYVQTQIAVVTEGPPGESGQTEPR